MHLFSRCSNRNAPRQQLLWYSDSVISRKPQVMPFTPKHGICKSIMPGDRGLSLLFISKTLWQRSSGLRMSLLGHSQILDGFIKFFGESSLLFAWQSLFGSRWEMITRSLWKRSGDPSHMWSPELTDSFLEARGARWGKHVAGLG